MSWLIIDDNQRLRLNVLGISVFSFFLPFYYMGLNVGDDLGLFKMDNNGEDGDLVVLFVFFSAITTLFTMVQFRNQKLRDFILMVIFFVTTITANILMYQFVNNTPETKGLYNIIINFIGMVIISFFNKDFNENTNQI